MVRVFFGGKFKFAFSKLKDKTVKERVIEKIKLNPEIGKPMRNVRKGTRELYIGSSRLSYRYFREGNEVVIFSLHHKDEQ